MFFTRKSFLEFDKIHFVTFRKVFTILKSKPKFSKMGKIEKEEHNR